MPCARTVEDERPLDLESFCDGCETGAQQRFFLEAAQRELARRFEEGESTWSFEALVGDVLSVQRENAKLRGKGYPRGCDALLARALDIVRREEARPRRVYYWELDQKASKRDAK